MTLDGDEVRGDVPARRARDQQDGCEEDPADEELAPAGEQAVTADLDEQVPRGVERRRAQGQQRGGEHARSVVVPGVDVDARDALFAEHRHVAAVVLDGERELEPVAPQVPHRRLLEVA